MNAQQIAATSIYNQIIDCAVEYMIEHHHCSPAKAISKAVGKCQMYATYYQHGLRECERLDLERIVKARRNAARENWLEQS